MGITRDQAYAAQALHKALLAAGEPSAGTSALEAKPIGWLLNELQRLAHHPLDPVGEAQRAALLTRHGRR